MPKASLDAHHPPTSRRRRYTVTVRVLAGLLAILLVGPFVFAKLRPDPDERVLLPRVALEPEYRVYVVNWGYHTSIVLPQPEGYALGPPDNPRAKYVEYAWGDQSFYMQSNFWPHRLFATVFLPTASVTYVASWPRAPRLSDGMTALWSRAVTPDELLRLFEAVEGSIRHTSDGAREQAYPPAAGYRGRFYPAHGYYLYWDDCNRWTVDRLQRAGLAESGFGVVLSQQVGGRLINFRRE